MLKKTNVLIAAILALFVSMSAFAQQTTTKTTLSAAVATEIVETITVASVTCGGTPACFVAGTTSLVIDQEYMNVAAVNGTTITVRRGQSGSHPTTHASGSIVWVGPSGASGPFMSADSVNSGTCTASRLLYEPRIAVPTGAIVSCTNSRFTVNDPAPPTGFVVPRTAVTSGAYTAKLQDYIIAYTTLTGASTVTLPAATGLNGKIYIIKNESAIATNTIWVSGSTIDGSTQSLQVGGAVTFSGYAVTRFYSNGTGWFTW